jgi:hypothetical protein
MSFYRLQAPTPEGLPLTREGLVPDGFSGVFDYMLKSGVEPVQLPVIERLDISPPHWSGFSKEVPNPYTDNFFYVSVLNNDELVVDIEPAGSETRSKISEVDKVHSIVGNNGMRQLYLPKQSRATLVTGASPDLLLWPTPVVHELVFYRPNASENAV